MRKLMAFTIAALGLFILAGCAIHAHPRRHHRRHHHAIEKVNVDQQVQPAAVTKADKSEASGM